MKIIFQQKTEYVKGCLWMSCVTDLHAVLLKNQTWILRILHLVSFFLNIFTWQLQEGFGVDINIHVTIIYQSPLWTDNYLSVSFEHLRQVILVECPPVLSFSKVSSLIQFCRLWWVSYKRRVLLCRNEIALAQNMSIKYCWGACELLTCTKALVLYKCELLLLHI